MTDAALAVTERAVEKFTEAYLNSLGADIVKDGRRWTVSLPDDAETDLELNGATLEIASDVDEVGDESVALAPESPFVERLIEEAANRTPVGSLALTGQECELQHPPWLKDGPAEVTDEKFTPYYDRRALCALFHVGIETVSEYQTEDLRAVAVDLNDNERRPRLAETYLELTEAGGLQSLSEGMTVDEQTLADILDTARDHAEDAIAPVVRDTRKRATRAAGVELDEYRQFARQRRSELDSGIDSLTDRIAEATETIDAASGQNERVEALRKRKELRAELDDVRSELDDLTTQIERGFPKKRREIRDRHSLTVRIRPVTATSISYERGDLELELRVGDATRSVSYPYAVGTGVMEVPECERCGQELTSENALRITDGQLLGSACCGD
ncbi:hypothetical protein SAMN04487949_3497 [Halogranum gelatinilyticum]|uniref:Uncharacterized protein n=1 Tax=Halogranum gelatinilyticum TaxID=660521 RepID=A0A1G9Z100_9EURY|nr:hypothetical protein [Halogranum gelatinilyticum]SDN14980.1 hypothetical protein SAMN04487949_3497 [Halogranum gelatinilyticum]